MDRAKIETLLTEVRDGAHRRGRGAGAAERSALRGPWFCQGGRSSRAAHRYAGADFCRGQDRGAGGRDLQPHGRGWWERAGHAGFSCSFARSRDVEPRAEHHETARAITLTQAYRHSGQGNDCRGVRGNQRLAGCRGSCGDGAAYGEHRGADCGRGWRAFTACWRKSSFSRRAC